MPGTFHETPKDLLLLCHLGCGFFKLQYIQHWVGSTFPYVSTRYIPYTGMGHSSPAMAKSQLGFKLTQTQMCLCVLWNLRNAGSRKFLILPWSQGPWGFQDMKRPTGTVSWGWGPESLRLTGTLTCQPGIFKFYPNTDIQCSGDSTPAACSLESIIISNQTLNTFSKCSLSVFTKHRSL